MVRGPGKFKTKRGGGRNFSRDMELDSNGIVESRSSRNKKAWRGDDDDDDDDDEDDDGDEEDAVEEEEEGDDEDDEDEGEEEAAPDTSKPELTRTERRELKKKLAAEKQAQKKAIDEDDEDADLINPNHVEQKLSISDLGSREPSRKEREKKEARNNYLKLHYAGKTDEAKSDLARLKKIKEEREAAQAKRKAEAEAKAAEVEAKKKAATSGKRI